MEKKNTFVATKKSNRPLVVMGLMLAIGALLIGINYGFKRPHHSHLLGIPKNLAVATVLPEPRPTINFSLVDNQGKAFTNASLQGHWTFVFFGFTRCGSICPTTMAALAKVQQNIAANKAIEPEYLLITLDPERDTVKKLNDYVTAFNKSFLGATGTQDQIDNLTKAFNVVYMKVTADPQTKDNQGNNQANNTNSNNYTIDHSGALMLLNPNGDLVAIFSMPHDATKIASDFIKIENYYS